MPPLAPDKRISNTLHRTADVGEAVLDTERPDLPDLMIVGDSFCRGIEPIVYWNFDKTRTIDLRWFKTMSVYEFIDWYKPDYVIYLLSGHTIGEDSPHTDLGTPPKDETD